ncbi:site-specific integrase [Pigmentiphaga sp. H8]|uniref:tyrosine-type recombinase/integrase n=1 Tax=Pigmentiphaga sp. H8 TaxID=2488560 RepID=UPI000F5A3B57|nr:site-specific integrase [Pigmentiphaga sp. H8]AZG10830.1 site-specific integrase [Pigmentiphaga sp. H8]
MVKTFTKLDRRRLRELAPGKKVMEHGIEFQRLANGDGVYSVNIMVDGQRIHRVLGRESDGVTRTQAEQFIEKARTDARHDRLALPKGRKVALSFHAAAGKYIEVLRASGGKDVPAKKSALLLHLTPFFGDRPLSKITSDDIGRYKAQRLQEVVQAGGDQRSKDRKPRTEGRTTSPGTVNRELATLSHLFSIATEQGWITTARPKIEKINAGGRRIVYLTVPQARKFLDAAKDSDNPQLYPFVLIAVSTSMRKGEILRIRKEHIDLDRRMIFIPKAKAGAREQPITAALTAFLRTYLEQSVPSDTPWLFPSPRGSKSGHTVAIEKPFRESVARAGLDPRQVVRHTLRHTAVSHLVQAGVDLPTVQRVSGHKTLAMVAHYAHQDGDHIQSAMDKLESRISGTITRKLHKSKRPTPQESA